ncbi:MAG: metallophosphoesterase [Candidatus Latescibacterota bacterium]
MRTLFIGDVHGCRAELDELLARLDWQAGRERLLLVGDAFARGPDPLGAWEAIRQTGALMVLGNHDDRLLQQLRDQREGRPLELRRPDHRFTFAQLLPVAEELLPWLEALPLYICEPGFLLVHAGIDPEGGLAGTTRDQFLAIRTWPPSDELEGPRWHDALPLQERPLIFGHDAPGGLVVKRRPDGRISVLGLDSGCVYGGPLTGYVLEEDRLVQARCRRPGGYYRREDRG